MHLTTRVEGDPHQNLLREKGGTGFPYLVFMDAEGEILAKQGERTVDAFLSSAQALKALGPMQEKAAKGDPKAKIELLIAELNLGKLTFDQASARKAELVNVSKEQQAKIDGPLAGLEYQALMTEMRDPNKRDGVSGKVLAMYEAGRVPSGMYEMSFLSNVMMGAEKAKDATTFAKALERMKALAKDRKGMDRAIEQMEARLKKLKDGS